MTNGVGKNNIDLISTADLGGQRLLGIPSLTNYINNGTTLLSNVPSNDVFNAQIRKEEQSPGNKAAKTITALSGAIAAGVGIAYLVKTGKVDFAVNKFKNLEKDISSAAKEIWQDVKKFISKKR
ncbi:hypothetical protein IJ425_01030 [bacterium]|nr:hypothetical protein [bacterium]